jgi:cytoskeletal protein CcmA (bactofilin family)
MRTVALAATMLLFGFVLALRGMAAEVRSGDDVVIKADETIADDLYVFGRHITIDGKVEGDVVAFGEQITINGTVYGDVIAAGQTVVITGTAEGARIAGQVLKLGSKAKLDGDILAAGYSLELEKETVVSGDALYAGFQALFAGQIDEDLRAGLVNCRLAGKVGGDVDLEVGGDTGDGPQPVIGPPPPVAMPSVPGGLTLTETAAIEGDLSYQASKEAKIDPMAKVSGETKHKKPAPAAGKKNGKGEEKRNTAMDTALVRVRHLACVAIVGLVVLLVLPRWSGAWADNIRQRPGASFLSGILGFIAFIALLVIAVVVIIVAAILLGIATLGELIPMVIVGGIVGYLALIVGFWLLAAFLAEALTGLAVGRMAIGGNSVATRVVALILGLIVVGLVLSIPFVGPWIGFVILLFGLGGFCLWLVGSSPAEETFGPPPPMAGQPPMKPMPARA